MFKIQWLINLFLIENVYKIKRKIEKKEEFDSNQNIFINAFDIFAVVLLKHK